ncbi:MAG: PilX N-terminal domain-containing pilus assembly protein [Gammaproteobacteria bacterium]
MRSAEHNLLFREPLKRQTGVATLLTAVMLMIGTTVITFSVARTGMMEVRMANNEYRAKEVHEAAEAGLEYGFSWLADNTASWAATEAGIETATPDNPAPAINAGNGDTYNAVVIFSRDPVYKYFIQVSSVATSATDASITATLSQYVSQDSGPLNPSTDALPFTINGCLNGVNGNPSIFPEGYEEGSGTGPFGGDIATSQDSTVSGSACIELGALDLNGGSLEYNEFTGSAWDYIFSKTRAEIQALADAEVAASVPDSERRYIWVTDSGNFHDSWGSPSNPVILIFAPEAACPRMNGGPVIYGIVFIDSDCPGANGWGGLEIYGSVIVDGDMNDLNSNPEFYDWSEVDGGGDLAFPPDSAPKIIGTWSDF